MKLADRGLLNDQHRGLVSSVIPGRGPSTVYTFAQFSINPCLLFSMGP